MFEARTLVLPLVLAMALAGGLTACDGGEDEMAEETNEAAEQVGEAAEDMGEAAEEAGDEIGEEAEEATQ